MLVAAEKLFMLEIKIIRKQFAWSRVTFSISACEMFVSGELILVIISTVSV
jgi:hypothetical protein